MTKERSTKVKVRGYNHVDVVLKWRDPEKDLERFPSIRDIFRKYTPAELGTKAQRVYFHLGARSHFTNDKIDVFRLPRQLET